MKILILDRLIFQQPKRIGFNLTRDIYVKKISISFIIAISAFLIGIVSATTLSKFEVELHGHSIHNTQIDQMGNVRAIED